jgi:ribosomal-protein-alanine N-acetyltransferase
VVLKFDNGEIHSERLHLRKFCHDDLGTYSRIMESDEIGKWLPKGKGYTKDEAERMLKYFREHWDKYGFGAWAVTDREDGKLMGH